jgi:hypothetical protein
MAQSKKAQSKGLSVLTFGKARLAFPLEEVLAVQPKSLIESACEVPLAIGSLIQSGRRWPVFGLEENFKLSTSLSAQRTYCICLSADDAETGLALVCDTVNGVSLADSVIPPPLPDCMRFAHSPLRHWYRLDEVLLPVSNVLALAGYIKSLITPSTANKAGVIQCENTSP